MRQNMYSRLAERFGYPFYLYDETTVAAHLAVLRETFPDFRILYSVKTNPHPAVLRFMAENGVGADAASSYEVQAALDAGMTRDGIFYSAPGKTVPQLRDAMGSCTVIADSLSEIARVETLAGESAAAGLPDRPLAIGLRINPDISFGPGEFPETGPGVSSKFGLDEERLAGYEGFFAGLKHVRMAGLHVYIRSQNCNAASIAGTFEAAFRIAVDCQQRLGWEISFINFGGGFGIATEKGRPGLDTATLRTLTRALTERWLPRLPGCVPLIESGRFLLARAGTFVSRIEDIKESRGKTYLIVPGGLSGFLRPSVMSLLNGMPCEVAGPLEPLYTNPEAHKVSLPEKEGGVPARVTVCGNLCTALDVIERDAQLPSPAVGDVVAVSNAGAYAASLSPFAFTSFPRPAELFRKNDGTIMTE